MSNSKTSIWKRLSRHTGIGLGRIVITVKNREYNPGDTIQAVASFLLKEPTFVREMSASFCVEGLTDQEGRTPIYHRQRRTLARMRPLERAHLPFEFTIPADIHEEVNRLPSYVNGALDLLGSHRPTGERLAKSYFRRHSFRRYMLHARVTLPSGNCISGSLEISVE